MRPVNHVLISISSSLVVIAAYHFLVLPRAMEHFPHVSAIYTVNLRETTRKVKEEMLARTLQGETPDPERYRKRISEAFDEMVAGLPAGSVVLEEEVVASGMAGRINLLGEDRENSLISEKKNHN